MSLFGASTDTGSSPEFEGDGESASQLSDADDQNNRQVSESIEQDDDPTSPNSDSDSEGEDEDESRPNRFHGNPSTWRSWNKNDIQLYNSLDQIWSNDTADAALLFENGTSMNVEGDESWSWRSSRRWKRRKMENGKRIPKQFGLWPQPPDRVPGIKEEFGEPKDPSSQKVSRDQRFTEASQAIKESLIDYGLRCARRGKTLEPETIHPPRDDGNHTASPRTREQASQDTDSNDEYGHTHGADNVSRTSVPESTGKQYDAWMFSADDDFCRSILSDIPNSILPKLDKLLFAMHHSRQGHHAVNDHNASSKTTRKGISKDRQPVGGNDLEADSGLGINEKANTKQQKEKKIRRVREINPRDWSEVLGAAALTGWDVNAVKRAAARCSLLFGEDMAFATLYESLGSEGASLKVEHASRLNDSKEAAGVGDPGT